MKSGQVSLFIVFFLILIGILGITFHLLSERNKSKDNTGTIAQQKELVLSVRNFLTTCLETSSESAIEEILLRGGMLGNSTADTASYASIRGPLTVGFGISLRTDAHPVPTYPSYTPILETRPVLSSIFDPGFANNLKSIGGVVSLTKLCDRWGPNEPSNEKRQLTCELATYGIDGQTIQNLLQQDIYVRTKSCLDQGLLTIGESYGKLSYIVEDYPTVTYTDDDIRVNQRISATLEAMPITAGFEEVSVVVPVRLKLMYNELYYLLDSDIRDPQFHKVISATSVGGCNNYDTTSCWLDGFTVNLYKNVDNANNDVVELIDDKSSINGEPVHFYVAVPNRRPVIDVMGNPSTFAGSQVSPDQADYYVHYGSTILFQPRIYDFDEDDVLTVDYSGWLGDTFDRFSSGCWDTYTPPDDDGDGFPDGPTIYSIFRYGENGCTQYGVANTPTNYWESSTPYISGTGCSQNRASVCAEVSLPSISYEEQPYYPEYTDVLGVHTIRVTVSDGRGKSDYQDVHVVVGTD